MWDALIKASNRQWLQINILESVTKFLGTVHEYTDLKFSPLALPSNYVVCTQVSEPIWQNNIGKVLQIVSIDLQFCPKLYMCSCY